MKTTLSIGKREQGAVLIISLIILVILTILGMSAMQSTSLEERMAGNMRDRDIAFQAAEAGLRDGEAYLQSVTLPTFDGTNGLYQPDNSLWTTVDWTGTGVRAYSGTIDQVAVQPTYYLEELPNAVTPGSSLVIGFTPPEAPVNYRVTAHGVGVSNTSVAILQSTFRR